MDVHSKFRICSISCKCPPRACGSAWHFLLLILTYVYPDSDARTGTNIHVHSIASSRSPMPTVPPNAGDPTLRRSLPPRPSFRLALIEHNRRGLHGQPLVPFHYTLRIQYIAGFSMHNSVPSNPLPPQPVQSREASRTAHTYAVTARATIRSRTSVQSHLDRQNDRAQLASPPPTLTSAAILVSGRPDRGSLLLSARVES